MINVIKNLKAFEFIYNSAGCISRYAALSDVTCSAIATVNMLVCSNPIALRPDDPFPMNDQKESWFRTLLEVKLKTYLEKCDKVILKTSVVVDPKKIFKKILERWETQRWNAACMWSYLREPNFVY